MRVDARTRARYTACMGKHWQAYQQLPRPGRVVIAFMALGTLYDLLWIVAGVYAEFGLGNGAGPLDTPVLGHVAWAARDAVAAIPGWSGGLVGVACVVVLAALGIAGLPGVAYLAMLALFSATSAVGELMDRVRA